MKPAKFLSVLGLLLFIGNSFLVNAQQPTQTDRNYNTLTQLFHEWRAFETPPLRNGAPDYTAKTFTDRHPKFKQLQEQLMQIDTSGWPVSKRVDWTLVWAEMNGYDFNHRILQPWVRDPAFYKSLWTYRSDVPAHEGPTHHLTTEIWTYQFPLTPSERTRLISDLKVIPPLNEQAQLNLTGNARDLWIAGIRDIKTQSQNLQAILDQPGVAGDAGLEEVITEAISSTDAFADWLEEASKEKTGPSGIGKDNYTWYLQNVHLVPLTWDDEVLLMKRELARAWSALKLEEHRNRGLPKLNAVDSPEAYDQLASLQEKLSKMGK